MNSVSFGKTYLVTTQDNSDEKYNRFSSYCKLRSAMARQTLHTEPSHFYSKYKICTLDAPKCMEQGVEEYCKANGIKFVALK